MNGQPPKGIKKLKLCNASEASKKKEEDCLWCSENTTRKDRIVGILSDMRIYTSQMVVTHDDSDPYHRYSAWLVQLEDELLDSVARRCQHCANRFVVFKKSPKDLCQACYTLIHVDPDYITPFWTSCKKRKLASFNQIIPQPSNYTSSALGNLKDLDLFVKPTQQAVDLFFKPTPSKQ